jgi:hypothetical protein
MNADDDLILARIGSILDDIAHRDSLPFNGLMGEMPEWVPQPFKDEFRRTRNSLLNNHSENQIIKWINEYKMMVNAPYGVSTPNISYEISLQHQIERLFILHHAVELGEIKGLTFLAGPKAVIGNKVSISNTRNARLSRPIENHEGESLDDVIASLKKMHGDLRPAELWVHFKTAIVSWSDDDCSESGKGDSRKYIYYKNEHERDSIAYATFRKKLNKL